jgi:predicted nucleotidyltransferase
MPRRLLGSWSSSCGGGEDTAGQPGEHSVWVGLCRRYRLRYIILYGSRAKGLADPLSDWDFAVRFGRKPSLLEVGSLASDIADIIGDERVDILVLDEPHLPPPLLYEALWEGKPLCILDREVYIWDRVRALSLYQEYQLIFRPELEKMVEELAKREPAKKGEKIRKVY